MKLPKSIKHNPFYRGILFGLGIISILFTGALVAVAVSGTMNTFSSGQVLHATAMNLDNFFTRVDL
ncbi:MAG: hypothetical protein SFU98_04630 [Leptospiraceae bacterium]|nr:hypothetical protein [Leptospiraceae bacterium]